MVRAVGATAVLRQRGRTDADERLRALVDRKCDVLRAGRLEGNLRTKLVPVISPPFLHKILAQATAGWEVKKHRTGTVLNRSFSWKRTPEYKLLSWLTHEVAQRTPPLLSPTRLPSRSAPPRTVRPEPRYHGPLSGGTALTPCDQGDVALRTALRPTHCLLASQCSPAGARSLWAATRELVSPPRVSLLLCPRRPAKIISVTCHFRYPGLPVALARLKRAALRLLCHRRAVALHASAIILLVTRDRRVCQAHQSVETLSPALSWDCA